MENSKLALSDLSEQDPGYGKIFAVLVRRKFWLLGGLGLGLTIAILINVISKPKYTSSMKLLVESTYKSNIQGNSTTFSFVDSTVQIDYTTQLNLLQSSTMFQKAANLLIPEYPKITGLELQTLKVGMLGEKENPTKIVEVQYIAENPVKTRQVLRAFQKVYTEYNREQQAKRLETGLQEIDEQIRKVRESIVEVSDALEAFRRKNNLFDTSVRVTEITTALNAIELQQRTAKIDYEQAISKLAGLQKNLPLSPQDAVLLTRLNQSLRYQALLTEMQTTEVALNRERARFQESNPIVEALAIRFNQQQQSLEEERRSILGNANLSISSSPNSSAPKWNSNQLGAADLLIASQIADTQNQVTLLQTRLDSLASQENSLRAEMNRLPKLITEYESLKPKLQIQQDSLQALLKNRQELSLQIARGGFDWQVVEEPALGKTNFADTLRINLLLGVVVGLFFGGAAALIRDRVDDTLHSFDELEQYLSSLELLGMTPQYLETDEISTELLPQFLKEQTFSPFAIDLFQWVPFRESLDLIYKNIQLRNHDHLEQKPVRSLVITSALSGEGKSTIAIGLATCAARLHKRVLLIDADMRKPTLHKKLNLSNARGLSTLLASQGSIDSRDVIQSSNTTIDILTAGPIPKDSVTLLSSEWLQQLISSFEEDYDFVIIDSPPVLGTVDTIQIATCSSAVVAVGRIDRITRGEFTQAISILQKLNLIGVIANGVKELPHIYSDEEIDNIEEEN